MRLLQPRTERGFILITTLLVVTILALLGITLAYGAAVSARTADNNRDALARDLAAESALNQALALLAQDAADSKSDNLTETWARGDLKANVGKFSFLLAIRDEDGKLNVHRAAVVPDDPEKMADLRGVLSNVVSAAGGTSDDYDRLIEEVDPKQPFFSVEQLRHIAELAPRLFISEDGKPALDALLSTHASTLNVNTASKELLEALWSDPVIGRNVAERRENNPFETTDALESYLKTLPEYAEADERLLPILSVSSEYFAITVTPSGAGDQWSALVERQEKSVSLLFLKKVAMEKLE